MQGGGKLGAWHSALQGLLDTCDNGNQAMSVPRAFRTFSSCHLSGKS